MAPPTDTPDTARRLFLLDGHSLAYRAYFALPASLATSTGQITYWSGLANDWRRLLTICIANFHISRRAQPESMPRPASLPGSFFSSSWL